MFYVFKLLYREYQNSPQILNLDKRFCHWPLAGSPWPMVALITMYLLFVLKLGPKFMERRPPYDVKKLMQMYNIIQILANIYVVVYGSKHVFWNPDFKWLCQEFDINDYSPRILAMRYPSYVYYICKYLDFLDTVFFVLRKKHNQVTFLHVYHHVMMVFASWVYHQRFLGTHFSYVGIINAFVHVIMYMYYFTAALDIKLNLYECKRRLTQLQIIQFLGLSILFATPLCMSNCNLNRFWLWVASIQDFFIFLLFADFYRKAYRKPKKAVPSASTSQSSAATTIPTEHTKQP